MKFSAFREYLGKAIHGVMQKAMKWHWVVLFLCTLLAPVGVSGATYYIDFASGNDANNGGSKATPWKHAPGMQNCTGNCASKTPAPGDAVIFKGSVTWDSTCWSWVLPSSGTIGNPIYYGVDQSWFNGVSWSRPVFDGGMVVPTADSLLRVLNVSYLTFDNIEMKNLLAGTNEGPAFLHLDSSGNILMENLYLHGWDLQEPGNPNDSAHGAIYGTSSVGPNTVDHALISNSEFSLTHNNGVAIRSIDEVSYTTVHDVSSLCLGCVTVHHSTFYNISFPVNDFDPSYHTNGIYLIGNGSVYDTLIYNFAANGAPIYPNPASSGSGACQNWTQYIYNNVIIFASSPSAVVLIDVDPDAPASSGACGTVYIWNNTLQSNGNKVAIRTAWHGGATTHLAKAEVQNNHVINLDGADHNCFSNSCDSNAFAPDSFTYNHSVFQTNATANAQGYTRANNYAPANRVGGTVSRGVVPTSLFNTDIRGMIRPQSQWDIGAYEFSSPGTPPNPPGTVRAVIR
jgi:hypothetical protein